MIGPMVLVIKGDVTSAIKQGMEFYGRQKYADIPAMFLITHPTLALPENTAGLEVRTAKHILPNIIWICRSEEEDK